MKPPSFWRDEYIDGRNAPFAEFVFRYCSKSEFQIVKPFLEVYGKLKIYIIRQYANLEKTVADLYIKEALQSLGLIARTPSPLPIVERPVEEWSTEELRDFVRKRQV